MWTPDFFGDVATVNGKAWPNLNVKRAIYRFRVYDGSNARFRPFHADERRRHRTSGR